MRSDPLVFETASFNVEKRRSDANKNKNVNLSEQIYQNITNCRPSNIFSKSRHGAQVLRQIKSFFP